MAEVQPSGESGATTANHQSTTTAHATGNHQPHAHAHHHARYGPAGHIVYHADEAEPKKAERVRELVRPWTIRQWIEEGRLHREPTPREVPRFELFFDLLFVAVIHALAEAAIEEPSGAAVARFVLTFWPSWSIWEEARKYANVSGTDDLLHRIWILIGMMTILGYAANASAIQLEVDPTTEEQEFRAVQAAAAFWLVIKLTRVLVLLLYAYRLPLFRFSQLLHALAVGIPMLVYLPLVWVEDRTTEIALASAGAAVDILRVDLPVWNVLARWQRRRRGESWGGGVGGLPAMDRGWRIPAMNIEHALERYSAFVVIVLGELVMNLLYKSTYSEVGVSAKFGRAALGLMIAWALNYLYLLPSEPNAEYEHALRRNMVSGLVFGFAHWPLVAALILVSASVGEMIQQEYDEVGVRWYFAGGMAVALVCLGVIDTCHRNLQPATAQRVPRIAIFLIAIVFIIVRATSADDNLTSTQLLAIGVGLTWFLVALNVLGMLPRKGKRGEVRLPTSPGEEGVETEQVLA